MTTVTANDSLVELLGVLREATEIRDARGTLIGIFTPHPGGEEERLRSLFNMDEAERTLAEEHDAGRPLKEFWRAMQG